MVSSSHPHLPPPRLYLLAGGRVTKGQRPLGSINSTELCNYVCVELICRDRQTDTEQTHRGMHRLRARHEDRQTGRQTDRQADLQTGEERSTILRLLTYYSLNFLIKACYLARDTETDTETYTDIPKLTYRDTQSLRQNKANRKKAKQTGEVI